MVLRHFGLLWNSISIQDDNWLDAGMRLNLIKDAVCVGVEESQNVQTLNNNRNAQEHSLYKMGHLDFELSQNGKLGDPVAGYYAPRIKEIFNHDVPYEAPATFPFVLDFDLDCFSMKCVGETVAWPYGIFFKKYCNQQVASYMQKLIKQSSVITICRESHYCGGLGESSKILQYLDCHFFNNVLKASPINEFTPT